MFHKHEGGKVTILIVYVNSIFVTRKNLAEIRNMKDSLAKEFEIKNLGDLGYFLGIEVVRSKKRILSQRKESSFHKESIL